MPIILQDGVFLLYGCCDPFNEKALWVSKGASFQLPIVSGEWTHLKSLKKEFEMRILAGHPANSANSKLASSLSRDFADSLAETPLCLVLGSEGSGLSENSRQECELVSIPLAEEFESLNVSVAGGIFLYMLQPNNSAMNFLHMKLKINQFGLSLLMILTMARGINFR
ncbi:hypothetical protein M9H77_19096 [Catharanthus roseus]|uniref:Uncharacterized protein n=1 Tax=Catharanthus roseus TaxID=4058 RepID=A0ACC0B9E7_CATRO|nr:hypothetical protein M9H77_19096 [Catharanthus roseus]